MAEDVPPLTEEVKVQKEARSPEEQAQEGNRQEEQVQEDRRQELKNMEKDLVMRSMEMKKREDEMERKEENQKIEEAAKGVDAESTQKDGGASFAKVAEKVKNNKDKTELQQFESKMIGDEAKFMCDRCEFTGNTNRSVKLHWSKKHRREAQEEEDALTKGKTTKKKESKKSKPNDKEYNIMDKFGENGRPLEETINDTMNETGNENMDTDNLIDLTSTPKSKSPVKLNYQDELNVKTAEVESLQEVIKQKQEMLNLVNGKLASLEEADIEKTNELEKAKRIMKYYEEKLDENKKNTKGDEPKLRKEVGEKNKMIKELQTKLNDAMKNIREETNLRAKAEADVVMKDNSLQLLKEIIDRRDTASQQAGTRRPTSPRLTASQQAGTRWPTSPRDRAREQSSELCRDFQRHGFCYRGERCRFFHPPGSNKPSSQPDPSLKPDCAHWLAGYCRYREEKCRGKHDANKCGTQAKQKVQSNEANQQDFNNPDFVQTLAKAVSQSLAGVQSGAQVPTRGQTQAANQPQQQSMNQNIPHQPMMMNQHQQQMMQQPMMMPMMMLPHGQNMGFPNPQGGQGSRQ